MKFPVVVVLSKVVAVLLLIIATFKLFSFLEIHHEEVALKRRTNEHVAVVYALPTFHEEVVSVVACVLQSLGYDVIVYIGNGLHWAGEYLPFSGRRKRTSSAFYGECVSQWVTIRPLMKIVTNPDLLVFVTYPMLVKLGQEDPFAKAYLQRLHETQSRTSVVYVAHRTNELLHTMLYDNEQYIPRNRSSFLLLGEHTYLDAQRVVREHTEVKSYGNINPLTSPISLQYILPVLPAGFISPPPLAPQTYTPTFTMQGNFGGKHAHRKNPVGVLDCLRQQESLPLCDMKKKSSTNERHRRLNETRTEIYQQQQSLQNTGRLCRQMHGTQSVGIDLVGHVTGDEDLQLGSLVTGSVRVLSGLPHTEYYESISRAKFVLLGIAEKDYLTTRATSSVPAALIAQVPLVASREFLRLYPCLRDAPVHRLVAKDTECEAIGAALDLSPEQYEQARIEIANCTAFFWSHAQDTFRHMAAKRLN